MNPALSALSLRLARLRVQARRVADAGFEFLYPPACLVCSTPLLHQANDPHICHPCLNQASLGSDDVHCRRCGEPLGPYLDPQQPCSQCRDVSFAFERVIRWGLYEDLLREICLRGKRTAGRRLLGSLGHIAASRLLLQLEPDSIDLIVPVPQYWAQRITRPHNTAEILAREWSLVLAKPFSIRSLRKIRPTPKQVGLPASKRRENLRNAFRARLPRRFQGSTILLVDDVLTTGSTAHQASRALKNAGAGRIIVAVLARNRYPR